VRATSHARVGGRAGVSVRGRVKARRGLGRARVRLGLAALAAARLRRFAGLRGDGLRVNILTLMVRTWRVKGALCA